jgi:hypothetical protein
MDADLELCPSKNSVPGMDEEGKNEGIIFIDFIKMGGE